MKRRLSGLAAAAVLVTSILLAAGATHSSYALPSVSLAGNHKTAGQHVENEGTASIDSVKLYVKNNKKSNNSDLTVQLVKDGEAVATAKVSATDLSKKVTEIVADFDAEITGDYDIVVTSEGNGSVKLLKEKGAAGNLQVAKDDNKWDLKYELAAANADDDDEEEQEPEPVPPSTAGAITVYAHRIASEHWGPTFTGAGAKMFFVLYNSTGKIVKSGFADENGYEVTGLNTGEQYYIYPTDCDSCHDSDHDVVFRHWEDGSTERPRPVNAGASVGAYYEFVPHS